MKCNCLTRSLVGLATLGMVLPASQAAGPVCREQQSAAPSAKAAVAVQPAAAVLDVSLGRGGSLVGQVVDAQGFGIAAAGVSIRQNGVEIGQTSTGRDGTFAVQGLRGGLYQVVAGDGAGSFRLWTENTAPPAAQPAALVVDEQAAVRGQTPLRNIATSNVVIIGGIALAALSVPFIVHAARDKKSGS